MRTRKIIPVVQRAKSSILSLLCGNKTADNLGNRNEEREAARRRNTRDLLKRAQHVMRQSEKLVMQRRAQLEKLKSFFGEDSTLLDEILGDHCESD
jgi:GTP1/Obg family GTP-binding protein